MSGAVSRDIVFTWQKAVEAVEERKLNEATDLFREIQDFSAKIWFNLGTIDALQGNLTAADEKLKECLQRDGYLAVAHFQRGVIACQQGRLREGRTMFTQAQKNMRDCNSIDYKQLGLDLRLTHQQVQHNQTVIDKYLKANRQTTKIPVEELETLPVCLFRPARALVVNLEKKVFLEPAKVISAVPDFVQVKGSQVSRPKSSSAPTSPSAHHRLAQTPQSHTALTPPPPSRTQPPPSRPPPRLPPSTAPARPSGSRHHDNSREKESDPKQGDLKRVSGFPEGRALDRVSSSCLQSSSALEGPSLKGNQSRVTEGYATCVCGEGRAVRGCDCSRDNSFSVQSSESTRKPLDKMETELVPNLKRSVAERIKELEISRSAQGQGAGGGMSQNAQGSGWGSGQRGEVKGERSWPENGTKVNSRSKPPRPPPPKF